MTEIPEHLLKRAAERRAAKAGGAAPDDAAPAAAPAGDAPAAPAAAVEKKAKATAPLPTLGEDAPAAKPDIPVVAAAKNRKRVPYWAASVLALLPVWGAFYWWSVTPPPAGENDPLVIGAEVYSANCALCHQPNGSGVSGGGSGQQLSDGHVLDTFADPLDMVHWIHFGYDEGARENGDYGDADRPGGPMNINTLTGNMAGFDALSPEELAAVVIYIRQELSGGGVEEDPIFNVETFEEDPEALAAIVEAVIAEGPGGDVDLTGLDGSEASAE